jgi:hypothetical protein
MGIPREQQFGRKRGYFKIRSPARKVLADAQSWIILSKLLDSGRFGVFFCGSHTLNRMVIDDHLPNYVASPSITTVGNKYTKGIHYNKHSYLQRGFNTQMALSGIKLPLGLCLFSYVMLFIEDHLRKLTILTFEKALDPNSSLVRAQS